MQEKKAALLSRFGERVFAGRWIAGPYISDAIAVASRFNGNGVGAIINYLGEALSERKDISDTMSTYSSLIGSISAGHADAHISVKPTQIGLGISYPYAKKNYLKLVKAAKSKGLFIWLDMEESDKVDDTIRLYRSASKSGNAGICIQSYLRRSERDVARIALEGGVIRLVKGAYTEPEEVAYATRKEVTQNYYQLMQLLFKNSHKFMIATHDMAIIKKAIALNRKYKREMEFAMLNGIRNLDAVSLAREGHSVRVYIPFGPSWFKYSTRRLREAGHASLIARSLFSRQRI